MPKYEELYFRCRVTQDHKKLSEINGVCARALFNLGAYLVVQVGVQERYGVEIPWPLIAAIHFRESSLDFRCHLHNGDPLTERTTHLPMGRPTTSVPPFTWSESAIDCFLGEWFPPVFDIKGSLEFLERYNGLGYRKYQVLSPYLWDYTDQYDQGLFIADGIFDPGVRENRPGCVSILKAFEQKGIIIFSG